MALQNKLKAFVRFDGSGRVIPSSLILQKSKPKVGNWKEINATECCNGTPTTTSTTTTNGNTAHAFYLPFWTNLNSACNYPPNNSLIFYSASAVLQQGSFLFYDAALTSPAIGVYLNLPGSIRLTSVSGGYLQNYTCQPPTVRSMYAAYNPYNACQENGGSIVTIYTAESDINVGTQLYTNAQLSTVYNPYQYGNILSLNGSIYDVGDNGGNTVIYVGSCSPFTTSTTTTQSVNSGSFRFSQDEQSVCSEPASVVLYWLGTMTNGTNVFTDQSLTQMYVGLGYLSNTDTNQKYSTSNGTVFNNGYC